MTDDQITKDLGLEEFMQSLLAAGALYMPDGGITHNLAVAAWLNSSPTNVRRNVFHCTDGSSAPSVTVCGRDLTTVRLLAKWIEGRAKPQGRNKNLSRSKPCAPAKTRKKRAK